MISINAWGKLGLSAIVGSIVLWFIALGLATEKEALQELFPSSIRNCPSFSLASNQSLPANYISISVSGQDIAGSTAEAFLLSDSNVMRVPLETGDNLVALPAQGGQLLIRSGFNWSAGIPLPSSQEFGLDLTYSMKPGGFFVDWMKLDVFRQGSRILRFEGYSNICPEYNRVDSAPRIAAESYNYEGNGKPFIFALPAGDYSWTRRLPNGAVRRQAVQI